jgi:hypothetical protein
VLNAEDAKQLGIADRTSAVVGVDGEETSVTAYARADFPRGYVGLPVGLERMPVFVPGAVCTIRMGA